MKCYFPQFRSLPLNTKTICFIFAYSILWCCVIPGGAAFFDGVATEESMAAELADRDPTAHEMYSTQKNVEDLQKSVLKSAAASWRWRGTGETLQQERSALNLVRLLEATGSERVYLRPFMNDRYAFVWFISYFAILCAACVRPVGIPLLQSSAESWRTLLFGLGMLTFIEGPHQILQLTLQHQYVAGRRTFSYLHADFSLSSFILEEFRTAGFFIVVAIIVRAAVRSAELEVRRARRNRKVKLRALSQGLMSCYMRWQGQFALIAGAFLPWTYFFWHSVGQHGDYRFALVGVAMHLLWVCIAVLVSVPLVLRYRLWLGYRAVFISGLLQSHDKEREAKLALLEAVKPLSDGAFISSAIAAAATVGSPLLALFFGR